MLPDVTLFDHWNPGGFPENSLAADDNSSGSWRRNFIRTFLEPDIPDLGPAGIPVSRVETLLRLISHLHGQTINSRMIAESIDVSIKEACPYTNGIIVTSLGELVT